MRIGAAIEQVAQSETKLVTQLIGVGERHKADHEVFHLTKTLARMEHAHVDALEGHAQRYEASTETVRGVVAEVAEPIGRDPEPGLSLLRDLRHLHLLAAAVSIDWVALGQAAQAIRDPDLLETVTASHAETLRTLKWTTHRLKEAAPQILTS